MIISDMLENILELIEQDRILVSHHGYDELAADGIIIRDILSSIKNAVIVEEYPNYPKGPWILVLQKDRDNQPVHVVWGIPKGKKFPAVLITAYRPDPKRWEAGFLRRKK
jgi:hypothetical protein